MLPLLTPHPQLGSLPLFSEDPHVSALAHTQHWVSTFPSRSYPTQVLVALPPAVPPGARSFSPRPPTKASLSTLSLSLKQACRLLHFSWIFSMCKANSTASQYLFIEFKIQMAQT